MNRPTLSVEGLRERLCQVVTGLPVGQEVLLDEEQWEAVKGYFSRKTPLPPDAESVMVCGRILRKA